MKFHLLIVDDDQIILMLHTRIVQREKLGDKPLQFLNGKKALEYIQQHNSEDDVHLVLLDINMPVMSGWEMLDALRKEDLKARVHVAMVTSSTDKADLDKSTEYDQVFDFLVKPLDPAAISNLRHHPVLSEFITS